MDAWFAVKTKPQGEKKASEELRRAGLRVYLPKRSYEVRNRRTRADSVRFRPLLIGYLFIRFPATMVDRDGRPHFGVIRSCQGVKEFVRAVNTAGEKVPFPIPDRFVADFMRRQRRREFGRPAVVDPKKKLEKMRAVYRPGQNVRITDGPFGNFLAVLERLNDDLTLDVELSILGHMTPVNISVDSVELAA